MIHAARHWLPYPTDWRASVVGMKPNPSRRTVTGGWRG